jgi:hypothetical protein
MKKLLTLFAAALVLFAAGCNNDTGTGGNILGGNGNANVTFTMGTQQTQNGNTQFTWQPSVDVKVTKLIVKVNNQQIDEIIDNSGQTYTAGTAWAYPNEYTGVQSGQQWQFLFSGSIVSNNQQYTDVTANLTIP